MGLTRFPHGVSSFGIPIFGEGLGILSLAAGNIYYLVTAKASTNPYYVKLDENGISDANIFTTLPTAYAATTTRQNDIIIVTPGTYTETESTAWAKDNVHLIGVGVGSPVSDWTLTQGMPVFTTATTDCANIVNITGERNSFQNVIFENYGNNAACLAAVLLNGYGNSFYKCAIQGIMTAGQIAEAACCSLDIAAGGHYPYLEDCIIGQCQWGTRTSTTQGHLRFSGAGSSGPSNGEFRNCKLLSHAETVGVPMVVTVAKYAWDRYWTFDNCIFYNFWTNWADKCNRVFYLHVMPGTSSMILQNCTAVGYDEWQTSDHGEVFATAMPIVGVGGGLARQPTAPVGT